MTNVVRVAQVVGRMVGGGVEATVMNYYRCLDHSRVQFDFIIQNDSTVVPRDEIRSLGGHIYEVPSYKNPIAYIHACESVFRDIRPDIVHSNMNAVSVLTLLAAKRAGVKVRIAHSHSTSNPQEYTKTLVKNVLRPLSQIYSTHLAACSKHAARWLFGNQAVIDGRVHIIHNAIDLRRFSFDVEARRILRRQLGIGESTLLIGQVGRLCFQKNQQHTLEVFSFLHSYHPDSELVFIGEGEDLWKLQAKADNLGISRSVKFLGVQNNVASWYSAFDVLAFPSTYEGLGMVCIEAQAGGLPTVASKEIPAETVIVPELVNRLALSDSIDTWAKGIITMANSHLSHTRTSETRRLAQNGYDIKQSASELVEWYEQLVSTSLGGTFNEDYGIAGAL